MAKPRGRKPSGPRKPPPSRSGNPATRSSAPSGALGARTTRPPSSPTTRAGRPGSSVAVLPDELEVLPVDGVEYPQILRTSTYQWWRSMAGAAFGLALFLLMSTVVSQAVVAVFWLLTAHGTPYATYFAAAFRFEHPSGMLGANLGIVTLIPIAWVLMAVVHRVKPRWLASVQPRIRWRYLLICLAVATVALNGVLVLSTLASGVPAFGVQRGFWGFLVVILLTSPLQAAAEEIFFRGYLMQALGSFFRQPWIGVVISAVVFALFHGTQNLPLFVDRLAFGLLAGILVWRTGGLEAGIAAHVINNIFAYVVAGLTTSIATVRAVQEITWTDAAFDVGGFALFAALAYLVARRMRLRTRVQLAGTPGPNGLIER